MLQAIRDGALRVFEHFGPVHRLQQKMLESEVLVCGRRHALRIDELELVAAPHLERRIGLGTDAHPVEARGQLERAVGLDRHLESARMQRLDERRSAWSAGRRR
jgi:hypothetical protein